MTAALEESNALPQLTMRSPSSTLLLPNPMTFVLDPGIEAQKKHKFLIASTSWHLSHLHEPEACFEGCDDDPLRRNLK
jgi:hypothetical protein